MNKEVKKYNTAMASFMKPEKSTVTTEVNKMSYEKEAEKLYD
ncbi:MAG: hypothetical protein QNL62_03615 [Gammaproteobacteria bacterium]|nr:hypothetical protein [Gammaproteobacteria bacterium]